MMRYRGLILALFLLEFCPSVMAANNQIHLATLEHPPYIINTPQGAQGLTVEIVRTVFSRMDRPLTIAFYPVSRGLSMLQSGAVDGFFSIKKTPEREKSLLFPQRALMRQEYVFFVRKNARWHFSGDFNSLANARIGVVSKTSYGNRFDSAVRAGRFNRLDPAMDHQMNFRKLLAGRVDVVICSRLVGLYYLKALNGQAEVSVTGPVVDSTDSYLVFSRKPNDVGLSRQFDHALESMERDGTLKRLMNAYQLPQARILRR